MITAEQLLIEAAELKKKKISRLPRQHMERS